MTGKVITDRQYQTDGVNKLIRLIAQGKKRIVFQLPTGGGKTVCFSLFLKRFFKAYPSAIAKTLVHRMELKEQTERTFKHFEIDNVPVWMVETFNNRLKKGEHLKTEVIIIDECHLGNFRKIFEHFPEAIIIGFSATPISASKKIPLNTMYEAIVVCTGIKELIKLHDDDPTTGLCLGRHYSPETDLNKANIKKKAGEYDLAQMGVEFSKPKLVGAVVHHYRERGEGGKALVFNTTIEHNNLVNDAFIAAGYQAKTIDSEHVTDEERKAIFKWFHETEGAILNNVGIATTGFDEPTVQVVIVNRLTTSLTLWHQMCGRGSRPYPGKDYFTIIDLGGNTDALGPWHMPIDWEQEFYHPAKAGKGVAPMKVCPNDKVPVMLAGKPCFNPDGTPMLRKCGCMIYMSATKCEYCGFLMPRDVVYSDMIVHLKLVPHDLIVPRNSPITHNKAISKIADKIKNLPIFDASEKRGMLEQSIIKVNEQSDIRQPLSKVMHMTTQFIPLN